MTPNVFETDTWPAVPVGCFNSLTLQNTEVIGHMKSRFCEIAHNISLKFQSKSWFRIYLHRERGTCVIT